ncbi:MAG: phosphogluconate dehydrogenase (NAD(+)-dependent, decarboxylating) [Thermodesulfobacteriota bacterium]
MDLAMIGLGKMGLNMAVRLLRGHHRVVGHDPDETALRAAGEQGAEPARNLSELETRLSPPRIAWLMVPSGDPTEKTLASAGEHLQAGDILVDGGNSHYKDSIRRAASLKDRGIHFVDVGTSGGVWGLSAGYSLMIGGEKEVVERLRPIFETLAPDPHRGWGYVGPSGAGHFVKMIHNGIEYGLMQSYAEGLEILKAKEDFPLDLHRICEIWRHGSVVRSWLLDLISEAFADSNDLNGIEGWVEDSGEGRWTVAEAIDQNVPAPVITLALQMRLASRQRDSFAAKVLAAMRNKFGGHDLKGKEPS